MMKKPKALKKGDTLGLIAPSSPVPGGRHEIELSVKKLNELGFKVKVGDSCYEKYGYLSGSDEIRANDINKMFADKDIDGVMCTRGGYGTPRILDKLDYDIIRNNPKMFTGYSDITGLHLALNKLCNLVTFHGPMPSSDMLPDIDDFSINGYMKAITSNKPLGKLCNPEGVDIKSLVGGKASGIIVGGNLSLIAALMGTPYEIDTKGKILFIEDLDEAPYSIDRMMTELRLAGKFDDCTGIILGDFRNCEPDNPDDSLTLMQVFEDIIVPAKKPAIYNFKGGHCAPKVTVPLGVETVVDADNCTVETTESAAI